MFKKKLLVRNCVIISLSMPPPCRLGAIKTKKGEEEGEKMLSSFFHLRGRERVRHLSVFHCFTSSLTSGRDQRASSSLVFYICSAISLLRVRVRERFSPCFIIIVAGVVFFSSRDSKNRFPSQTAKRSKRSREKEKESVDFSSFLLLLLATERPTEWERLAECIRTSLVTTKKTTTQRRRQMTDNQLGGRRHEFRVHKKKKKVNDDGDDQEKIWRGRACRE